MEEILRTRIRALEEENERLKEENKRLRNKSGDRLVQESPNDLSAISKTSSEGGPGIWYVPMDIRGQINFRKSLLADDVQPQPRKSSARLKAYGYGWERLQWISIVRVRHLWTKIRLNDLPSILF